MVLSLQIHSPSASQMPEVWPRVTQLAEQAHWPSVHLNPPITRLQWRPNNNTGNIFSDILDIFFLEILLFNV